MKSNLRTTVITTALVLLSVTLVAAGEPAQSSTASKPKQAATQQSSSQSDSEQGQLVFHQNCSRCHKAPEAIRPSISGTVALHMRIRAGLSEKDYRRLLAFLNP